MNSNARILFFARLSLAMLWLFTAASSFFWARRIGYDVLAVKNITGSLATLCINAGSFVDAFIGLWLLSSYQLRVCYLAQIIVITSYSFLLTFIDASFWLHPFGPLTKNIPLLVFIYWLYLIENGSQKAP